MFGAGSVCIAIVLGRTRVVRKRFKIFSWLLGTFLRGASTSPTTTMSAASALLASGSSRPLAIGSLVGEAPLDIGPLGIGLGWWVGPPAAGRRPSRRGPRFCPKYVLKNLTIRTILRPPPKSGAEVLLPCPDCQVGQGKSGGDCNTPPGCAGGKSDLLCHPFRSSR